MAGGCGHAAGNEREVSTFADRGEPAVNKLKFPVDQGRVAAGHGRLFPKRPGSAIYRLPPISEHRSIRRNDWGDVAEWLKATVC